MTAHQRCKTCGHVLVWIGFTRLICPNATCPAPTTIIVAEPHEEKKAA